MKYLLILLLWGYNAGAQTVGELRFDSTIIYVHGTKPELIKCKHIYVAVEPDTVFESHNTIVGAAPGFGPRPTGKKILCVKCHHITDQMIVSRYPSGRSKVVLVDSLKMWLGYSPLAGDRSYELFWHPGLRQLDRYYEALIFGGGSDGLGKNMLPGPPHILISNLNNCHYIKGAGCITGTDKNGNTIYGNPDSPIVRKQ